MSIFTEPSNFFSRCNWCFVVIAREVIVSVTYSVGAVSPMVYNFGQVASDVNQVISSIDPMTSNRPAALNGAHGGIRFNLDIMIMTSDVFKFGSDFGSVGIRCWHIVIRCWPSGITLLTQWHHMFAQWHHMFAQWHDMFAQWLKMFTKTYYMWFFWLRSDVD